jgi:hypothetical protein
MHGISIKFVFAKRFIFGIDIKIFNKGKQKMNIQTMMMVSTVVIAVATVIYATITYFLLREQRREKEKPRIQEIVEIIIYPIMENLEKRKSSFKEGDFSWTQDGFYYHPQKVALPTHGVEKLIYDDFKKAYPEIIKDIEKYNKELEKQKGILDNFANKIRLLPDFKEKVYEKFEKYRTKTKSTKSSDSLFEPNTENIEYILEYVVNNKQKLNRDGYKDFWDQYGVELLKCRDKEEVEDHKAEVERGCKILLYLADRILRDLKDILDVYRKKYGISYKELNRTYPSAYKK